MFKTNSKNTFLSKKDDFDSGSINILGQGSEIQGNVKCNGDMRIDGTLIGSIKCNGKVVVGASGIIVGDLYSTNADILGKIEGNLQINEMLLLKSTANILGDIATGKLSVEAGANFSGACKMGAVVKDITNSDKKSEKIA
jgi:cytoskeletal protein CcmA (bactofilin family)